MANLNAFSEDLRKFIRPAADESARPPPIEARFFYDSPLQIDDPLSPVPPPSPGHIPTTKQPPRPFSTYDHAELDKAWIALCQKVQRQRDKQAVNRRRLATDGANDRENDPRQPRLGADSRSSSRNSHHASSGKVNPSMCVGSRRDSNPKRHLISSPSEIDSIRRRKFDPARSSLSKKDGVSTPEISKVEAEPAARAVEEAPPAMAADGADDSDLSGTPFIRAPSRSAVPSTRQKGQTDNEPHGSEASGSEYGQNDTSPRPPGESSSIPSVLSGKIPVGVSRLHEVVLPELQMLPIYWSPVHDISAVIRGTWFYESMLPVETHVANMLEAGYVAMQPWTETWNDELNSAAEVGAIGEMKIVHPLWPEPEKRPLSSRPSPSMGITTMELIEPTPEQRTEELLATASNLIDASTSNDTADHKAAGESLYGRDGQVRLYKESAVLYADSKTAYILRTSLQPSAYYGRRPLANYVRKGHRIGIPVFRGFNQNVWDLLNPVKGGLTAARAQRSVSTSQVGAPPRRGAKTGPELSDALKPNVTDLILVIHGIGQKLSERMESFHFTHSMNSFRRELNVELGSPNVRSRLREGMGGIMVLPVNWRSTLNFIEEEDNDGLQDSHNQYHLSDITPKSLPSVRNIISDVLLDIPYYLSQHQPKLIAAVTKEANRIYSLWCSDNPGFSSHGRVHLIAHSLGSVMAMDILSKQPTKVTPSLLKAAGDPNPSHFAFDTKNLICAGSPAGFFLLLKKAGLIPRKGRNKPGADGEDSSPGVAGEVGNYGCLAVDNIYNVVNPYDPVAYQLNATVDSSYAASLKPAFVPSARESWFGFSNPFKSTGRPDPLKRPNPAARLPSTVELETHNFTREELAEKRAYLLNDNGQIDYFMRYGGGPFEIQYLTMLGAHSSYWLSQDFVRFVCLEIGRTPGKEGTLESLRAAKKAFVS